MTSGRKNEYRKVFFAFLTAEKLAKDRRPWAPQKAGKMGNFSNSRCSNMKNFLSILTLFVSGAKGAGKRQKRQIAAQGTLRAAKAGEKMSTKKVFLFLRPDKS